MTMHAKNITPATLEEAMMCIAERDEAIRERDATIVERDRQLRDLLAKFRKQFGRSSERMNTLSDAQLILFKEAIDAENAASQKGTAENDEAETPGTHVKAHSRRNGRVAIPKHIPREHVVHELTPEERTCPCCGKERVHVSSETTEVLEYVPATMKAVVHERCKYACPECCGNFAIADPPNAPFDRSKAGPGLLAAVAVGKYADHLPLYRQDGIFKRFGVNIPRSTQSDWMRRTAEAIDPLAGRIAELIREGEIIQTDDTPIKLRDGPRKGVSQARFWSYVGDRPHPYVAYEFTPNRRGEHPRRWLADCAGYLQCDAFTGYDALFDAGDLVEVGCWAHARRKFHDARLSHPGRALEMLRMIKGLYAVERGESRWSAESFDPQRRKALRAERAAPLLDQIFETLRTWKQDELPKSSLGTAITYTLNLETALGRYLEDGELEIDNNGCERSLRGIALGRKNWLFAGSEQGGATAATIFTVLGSARLHEIEPWAYLRDVLDRMPHVPMSQIDDFLPDRWKTEHPGAHLGLNRGRDAAAGRR